MTVPRAAVDAPLRNPTRAGSLIASALTPDGPRWYGGIEYRPELDNLTQTWEPHSSSPATKTIASVPESVQYDPYVIWVGSSEFPASSRYDEEARRVTTNLDVQTSHKVEEVLWSNQVDATDYGATHPNIALADTSAASLITPNGITAVGIVTDMHDMVEALNLYLGGARGMVHTPQRLVPFLEYYRLIVRQGNMLQIAGTDHILVAGTGYSGSDPSLNTAAGEVWLYGTPPSRSQTVGYSGGTRLRTGSSQPDHQHARGAGRTARFSVVRLYGLSCWYSCVYPRSRPGLYGCRNVKELWNVWMLSVARPGGGARLDPRY